MEKSAEELQKEGRAIAAWGGFVYHVSPAQVERMVEYQIPHIVVEPIPTHTEIENEPTSQTASGTENNENGDR